MKLVIYLLKKIIPLFLGAMIFFSFVLNLVDLFINIATYLQNNCPLKQVGNVMLLYIPKTLWYAVPVAILFSTSYVLSDMYATNELEALFASGVSLLHFTFPILLISFLLSFGLFFFEDKLVVQTYEKKVTLQNHLLNKSNSENNANVVVISEKGRIIYKTYVYDDSKKSLLRNYFIFRDEDNNFETLITSTDAFWNDETKKWDLVNSRQYVIVDGDLKIIVPAESKFTDQLTEHYDIFKRSVIDVQSVNTKDAKIYIDHLKKAGLPYQEQLAEYYKKFSFPFIVFLVVFLSIGLTGKTKKNVLLVSLASCIAASVLFYVMMLVTMVFAKHGYISPFMGAWFPIFFFTVASVILLKYSRT